MSIVDRVDGLTPGKRALLQRRLAGQPLPARPEAGRGVPLSAAQRRMWTLHQLDASGRALNVPLVLRIRGPLHRPALALALALIAQRHDGLRLCVTQAEDGAAGRLRDDGLALEPLSAEPDAEAAVTRFVQLPFEPSEGLARAGLVALGADDHILALVFHHLVFDGQSIATLLGEMERAYVAFRRGSAPALPALRWRYADFARWERELAAAGGFAASRAAWLRRLEGAPPAVDFAGSAPAAPPFRPGTLSATFGTGRETYARLRRFAAEEGTTPFAVVLAGVAALLGRWGRTDDVVVGAESGVGVPARFDGLIGLFLNPLPIRVDLSGRPCLRRLVGQVRERLLEAFAHARYPFERLVADLGQSGQRQPLFNVAISLRNQSMDAFELDDLSVTAHPGEGSRDLPAKFALALSLIDTGSNVGGAVEADDGAWEPAALDRFARALEGLLAEALAAPGRVVDDIPLAGAQAHSVGPAAQTSGPDFAGLFEAAHDRAPDAPAAWFGGEATSHRALEARANRLARALAAAGAGRGRNVALHLDRDAGPDLVACVLAVLKAGAAFTVLDRRQASERHRAILEDAAPALVVTAGGTLPDGAWRALDLAALERDAAELPEARPPRSLCADDAAYVVFTSGSTGRPKGVVATHGGLSNLAAAQGAAFGLGPADRVVQFSAVTFDAFAWDLALAWGAGAALVLGTVDELAPGPDLAELLARSRATALTIPPSALAALPAAPLPSLRLLVAAGEPVPGALVDRWAPGRRMVNAYGPTEATIWASLAEAAPGASPPIGRAIAGASLHLLDDALAPVPLGAVGEIAIGGAGVARGYLNAPSATASAFVPDPFDGRPGARLYRTGDLGRWLPDGRVAFLGRRDDQLKIRGFRVEPAEVARSLERLPSVARAHVAAARRRDGEAALAAWVVPVKGAGLDPAGLRAAARDALPPYMRPAAYVIMAQFPANAHGKLDARRLPAPDWDAAAGREPAAPRTPAEAALAEVWAALLGVPAVGRDDDFFALGGDSILATRVISRLRGAGWSLKLTDVFAAPALSALALRAAPAGPAPGPAPAGSEGLGWPLTPSQAGMFFHHLRAPGLGLYVQRFDLTLTGPLDPAAFRATWAWLLDRHEVLRGHVRWTEGAPRFALGAAGGRSLVDRMLAESDGRAGAVAAPPVAIDPEDAPLTRMALIRTGDRSWRLVWDVHHMIADGWSLSVLIDEFHAGYGAFSRGARPDLPPAPPYRSYLAWLAGRDEGAARAFWGGALRGAGRRNQLAAADEGAGTGWSGETVELGAEATAALAALSTARGLTLNTCVQAAWARTVQAWTGDADVLSGMVVSNRPPALDGVERMVGLFVNTVPCRLTVPRAGSVGAWLDDVQARLALMQEHGHLALPELQRMMGEESGAGSFDALVVVQTFPAGTAGRADLAVEAEPVPARTDYPLTVLVEPGERLRVTAVADHRMLAPATARALGLGLAAALEGLPSALEGPVGAWSVGGRDARARTVGPWNATDRALPTGRMAPDLVFAAAARHRDGPALVSEAGTWTYGELARRADQAAAWLAGRGIGPESVVALLADRSPELVAATLGIGRAGAAFLPLGPEQPAERLRSMVARARPTLVIAHRRHAEAAGRLGVAVAWLDEPPWDGVDAPAPAVEIHPQSAAYVIFTSGSTGEPKGVVTSHVGLLNRLTWGQRHRPIGPGDRVAQKTPYTFDVSVWEMLWPLTAGASLVIARPGGHLDADYLAALIERERVTVMHFVPSMLRVFLEDEGRGARLGSLRRLICSGEALPGDLRDRAHALCGAELLNYYGPTEAAVEVGHHAAARTETDASVPLGRPIDNATLHIVDGDFNPCPPGFPGELLIGGVQVGRGYVGRPDLTAERFVPDPFSGEPGRRVYRTGDLARRRPDGAIEFLGRLDWQVKIRGQRVEPEEVAAAIKRLPGVRDAAVLFRPEGEGRLVAYLVGAPTAPADLRGLLAESLPEAMIPSAFLFLDALPLGPSGKLDRAALPAPAAPAAPGRSRPPADALEWRLAAEWKGVLGIGGVGPDDHFFADLGGHSLEALRLVGRLARVWPGLVSLGEFLRAPSVAGVARSLRDRAPPTRGAVALVPDGDGPPLVLVHPAVGSVICFIRLAEAVGRAPPARRGPVWALEAPGFNGGEAPIDDVRALARRHVEDLRACLGGRAPILAGYSYGGLVAFEMAGQLAEAGLAPLETVILDTPAPTGASGPIPSDLDLLIEIAHLLERYDGRPPSDLAADLAALPPDARPRAARERLARSGVLGGAVDALDLAAMVSVSRAAMAARARYRPSPYAGAVTVLRAASPSAEDAAGVDPALLADPCFGWTALVRGRLSAATAPGDHVSIILPPGVDAVAGCLLSLTGPEVRARDGSLTQSEDICD